MKTPHTPIALRQAYLRQAYLWLMCIAFSTQAQILPTDSTDHQQKRTDTFVETSLKSSSSKLDTALVSNYKKFTKAVKEKRLNIFDDSTDYALLHYNALMARKMPNNIIQLVKRNLAASLMERELEIMKDVRENGRVDIPRSEKVLMPAIANLQEAIQLFDSTHHLINFLKARPMALESLLPPKSPPMFANAQTVDKNLQDQQAFTRKYRLHTKELLLKSLELEPNMISTYALLAAAYRDNQQLDSALFYQEKVVKQLPNQAYAHVNLATIYALMPYTDAQNRPAPHPMAIANFEKAIALDPTLQTAYTSLGKLYMGLQPNQYGSSELVFDKANRQYAKAISCFEKAVESYQAAEQKLIKKGLGKIPRETDGSFNESLDNFGELTDYWKTLYFLHKANGNNTKAAAYLKKMLQKAEMSQSALGYLVVASKLYEVFEWTEADADLKKALDLQLKALKKADEQLKTATTDDKPLLKLKYKEQLKGIGATYRALKNYSEAQKYFQQAVSYPLLESSIMSNLKLVGSNRYTYQGRCIAIPNPHGIEAQSNEDYHYQLDANEEMFHLKYEQGKTDEAFAWLEKALQVSLAEHGNDISGKTFEESIFKAYKNLDQARFKALKAKYFP